MWKISGYCCKEKYDVGRGSYNKFMFRINYILIFWEDFDLRIYVKKEIKGIRIWYFLEY